VNGDAAFAAHEVETPAPDFESEPPGDIKPEELPELSPDSESSSEPDLDSGQESVGGNRRTDVERREEEDRRAEEDRRSEEDRRQELLERLGDRRGTIEDVGALEDGEENGDRSRLVVTVEEAPAESSDESEAARDEGDESSDDFKSKADEAHESAEAPSLLRKALRIRDGEDEVAQQPQAVAKKPLDASERGSASRPEVRPAGPPRGIARDLLSKSRLEAPPTPDTSPARPGLRMKSVDDELLRAAAMKNQRRGVPGLRRVAERVSGPISKRTPQAVQPTAAGARSSQPSVAGAKPIEQSSQKKGGAVARTLGFFRISFSICLTNVSPEPSKEGYNRSSTP